MMIGVIPVIGPVLALGPLAVTPLNLAGGAVAGSLVGALVGSATRKRTPGITRARWRPAGTS
jgi:hypothetical protein